MSSRLADCRSSDKSYNCGSQNEWNLRISFLHLAVLLKLFLVPLQVLNHQVLSGQFEVVTVVVHLLMLLQVEVVQDFVDGVSLNPEDVPIFSFDFAVPSFPECVEDAVFERRLELD